MPQPKSWFGSKALKFIWRTQETSDRNFNHYQEKSLLHYLDDMKTILIKNGLTKDFGVCDIKEKTWHVFSQLFHSKVQILKLNPGEKAPVHIKVAKNLPEVSTVIAWHGIHFMHKQEIPWSSLKNMQVRMFAKFGKLELNVSH